MNNIFIFFILSIYIYIMYAYTWRMWHITSAKYYETQIFGKQEGVHCSPSTAHNGVSRCLPYLHVK